MKGSFNKLFGESLKNAFEAEYKNTPLLYPRFIHKKYALGFRISREMIEDDIYGGIAKVLKKKRMKMKVQTIHRIDIGTSEVELDGDIIRITGSSYSLEAAKNMVKAVNMLLKLAKKPKKVVRRKRRKNAKA